MVYPLGIRFNNPGNLRYTPSGSTGGWRGAIPREQSRNKEYLEFESATLGIRAMAKLLTNYEALHGLNTVAGIINRWAPPEDNNNTSAYVNAVSKHLNVSPHEAINVRGRLLGLCQAIITHENGYLWRNHYSDQEILAGIALI